MRFGPWVLERAEEHDERELRWNSLHREAMEYHRGAMEEWAKTLSKLRSDAHEEREQWSRHLEAAHQQVREYAERALNVEERFRERNRKVDPTLLPDDRIPCPRCTSVRPKFRMMEASTIYRVKGSGEGEQLIERITGYRIACQDCPAVYMVGPEGTFFPHEGSLPISQGQRVHELAKMFGGAAPLSHVNATVSEMAEIGTAGPLPGKPRPRV